MLMVFTGDSPRPDKRRKNRLKEYVSENRTVVMHLEVLDRLRPHAEKRGITVNELVRSLIEKIIDDSLVDAVLDDARQEVEP